jgi:hypothetical protein
MSDEQIRAVEWNGNTLIGWITINGVPTRVTADKDTIHRYAPGFNDALTWEIKGHAAEIFQKLKPFFLAAYGSLSAGDGN